MAEKQGWGRMRAEKWKRSVTLVLNLWEGWCVFPVESHAMFVSAFENPPSLKAQDKLDESAKKGKWKVVEANSITATSEDAAAADTSAKEGDAVGEPIREEEEAIGEPIEEDDLDGEPLAEDDLDGEPIEDDDDVDGEPMDEDEDEDEVKGGDPEQQGTDDTKATTNTTNDTETLPAGRGQPKRRMRAADMFADSDNSDGN
ncbi:uncharacterized protein TrAtP1_008799 [Trichoderma atroviride]|nr:hypothetical protein TrAtP1_008799 [Trichoderma atroviride]